MITVLGLTITVFAVVMVGMAVGVIFQDKCLRGSCGGEAVIGPDGEDLRCATCPNRDQETGECANKDAA